MKALPYLCLAATIVATASGPLQLGAQSTAPKFATEARRIALGAPTTAPPLARNARRAGTVTGVVSDSANGRPLANVQVTVVGSSLGTITNDQGKFTIGGLTAGTHTLRTSFIGYAPQTANVTAVDGQSVTVDFKMPARAVVLDQIVSVGYGTQRRQDITGAVASISGEALKDAPITAVANALQGKAPGVQVTSNSGAPGGGASVRVRGTNSITANSEPLYIIDGVPIGQGSTAEGTLNPLAAIDPNNIESMEILKDASSTAIYGARGANGVVLITTKRGERGSRRVTLESSYGQQTISNKLEVLNSQQFMALANEANTNAKIALRYPQSVIDTAQTFDYLSMITRTAPQQSHALTISGGDERTRFLLSGNYQQQDGILVATDFRRYGVRLNLDQNINTKFRIGTSLSGTFTQQNVGSAEDTGLNGGVYAAMNFAPNVAPKDAAGNWVKLAVTSDQVQNPLANLLEIKNPRRTTRMIGNVFGEYDILSDLRFKSTLGANLGFDLFPYFAPSTVFQGGVGGVARRYSNNAREILSENTLNLRRKVGFGTLDALAGYSIQKSHLEEQQAESQLLPSNSLEYNNLGAGALVIAPSSNVVDWSILSYLGRAIYNIDDRYVLTATARRDGSSRFGANNKWATFPSVSGLWHVSNEGFMRGKPLSDLKFRVGYGRTGNQAIIEYTSLARLGTNFIGLGASPTAVVSLAPTNAAPNPDLKWETQDQLNLGVDVAFASNRISLTVDAYRTSTKDLLLNVALPGVSGYATQLQNVGEVKNVGYEVGINTINFDTRRFAWRSSFNISTNKNEVVDLGTRTARLLISAGAGSGSNLIVTKGEALSSFYGFKVLGLWQQGDTCTLTNTADCTPGEYKLQDTNGDKVIDDNDRIILAKADPKYYGGFTNNFRAGAFTLDAFINFTQGNKILNLTKQRNSLVRGVYNERVEVLNRWTPTNTNTIVPRANANRLNARMYSTLIEDGSFIRLQTITLGYQVPSKLLRGTNAARLYVTGQNLFTITDYTGFDPEVNRWGGNAQLRGIDQSGTPRARTWNVGVNLTF